MTFEDFKELALNPPYIEEESVYRVDVYRIIKHINDTENVVGHEVRLCQSFMYTDMHDVQFSLFIKNILKKTCMLYISIRCL